MLGDPAPQCAGPLRRDCVLRDSGAARLRSGERRVVFLVADRRVVFFVAGRVVFFVAVRLRVAVFFVAFLRDFGASPGALRCCAALFLEPGCSVLHLRSCRFRFPRNDFSDLEVLLFAFGRQLPCT